MKCSSWLCLEQNLPLQMHPNHSTCKRPCFLSLFFFSERLCIWTENSTCYSRTVSYYGIVFIITRSAPSCRSLKVNWHFETCQTLPDIHHVSLHKKEPRIYTQAFWNLGNGRIYYGRYVWEAEINLFSKMEGQMAAIPLLSP